MEEEKEKTATMDFAAQYGAMNESEKVTFRDQFFDLTHVKYSSFYYKMRNMKSLTYRDKKDIAEILEKPIEQLFPEINI